MGSNDAEIPRLEALSDFTPTFSVTMLHVHPDADRDSAFRSLVGFLRTELDKRRQALEVRCLGEAELTGADRIDGLGAMLELGVDRLFASVRERRTVPSWAGERADAEDVTNQLTLAVCRGRFVFLYSPLSDQILRKWLRKYNKLYRYLPATVLRRVFGGDGKQVWLRGVHRRRPTKADSKSLGGLRIQDALDDDEDASYAWTAATIDVVPADEAALVRGRVTVSPTKSRLYWQTKLDLSVFLAAVVETADLMDKAIAEEPQEELFRQLAIPETDLGNVRGAYDVAVVELDEVYLDPDTDVDELTERVALLRDAFVEVRGASDSADFVVSAAYDGAEVGTLSIKPVERGDGFGLDVRLVGRPSHDQRARQIRDAIGDGDLLAVYYESGHTYDQGRINVQRQTAPPFPRLGFADFTGYAVDREKPNVSGDQKIHDAIDRDGDRSLFAWVVHRHRAGWLVCDDHAGEVADFLHLDDHGVLTVIHVKGAANASPTRQVAVGPYQEVVAQAVKNLRLLDNDLLADRFSVKQLSPRAAWHDGARVSDIGGFVDDLRMRTAHDRTYVAIVQPHLRKSVVTAARNAAEVGKPTRDSRSLILLDGLLRSARKSVVSLWDDLTVIGSSD
jgi:hypothetical protein